MLYNGSLYSTKLQNVDLLRWQPTALMPLLILWLLSVLKLHSMPTSSRDHQPASYTVWDNIQWMAINNSKPPPGEQQPPSTLAGETMCILLRSRNNQKHNKMHIINPSVTGRLTWYSKKCESPTTTRRQTKEDRGGDKEGWLTGWLAREEMDLTNRLLFIVDVGNLEVRRHHPFHHKTITANFIPSRWGSHYRDSLIGNTDRH